VRGLPLALAAAAPSTVRLGVVDELIDAAYAKMRRRDGGELSSTSKQHAHRALHAALAYAVRKGLIAKNPADLAEKPKRSTGEMNTWDESETVAWLTHPEVVADRLYPAFVLLAYTGMRRGEVCGLRWEDIDLSTGRAVIRRSRASVGYEVKETTPKSGEARIVSIDPVVVDALRDQQQRQREDSMKIGRLAHIDSGYVLTNIDGSPIHPQALSDAFDSSVRRAGARKVRLHDLRHGHATTLLRHGVPVHVVAKRLGHADPSITLRVYAHAVESDDTEAAATFADALRRAQ
jgi:integrase